MVNQEEFPCEIPVALSRFSSGRRDVYGNPTGGYSQAVTVLVFAVVVGGVEEPTQYHPEAAEHRITVYAPASLSIDDRDRIGYQGRTFEVDGLPGNWDANPWWSPGLVEVRCKEVIG